MAPPARRLQRTVFQSSSGFPTLRLLLASQDGKGHRHDQVHPSDAQHQGQLSGNEHYRHPSRPHGHVHSRKGRRGHGAKRSSLHANESDTRRLVDNMPKANTSRRISCASLPGGCQGGGLGNATYQRLADERVRWTATANLSRKEIVLTTAQKQQLHDIMAHAKSNRKVGGTGSRGMVPHGTSRKRKMHGRRDQRN